MSAAPPSPLASEPTIQAPARPNRRRRQTPLPTNGNGHAGEADRIWYRSPWKWFFSLKVGIVLLVILTIASTIGTLIDPLERAQALVYYTWWFKLLLLALAINMGCATTQNIIQKLLPSRALRVHDQVAFFRSAALATRRPYAGGVAEVAEAFRRRGFEVKVEGNAGMARSGWLGRWGAPVSHVGLIVVLLAGFVASWVAKEGYIQVIEGGSTTTMRMRGTNAEVPLGFTITVDDFDTGFFPRTRIPSHYISQITATRGGQPIYAGPVEVNHSPRLLGWRAHQTSYQEMQGVARHEVEVTPPGSATPIVLEMTLGQTRALPGMPGHTLSVDAAMRWRVMQGGVEVGSGSLGAAHSHGSMLEVLVDRFEPDFVMGADRQATSRSTEPNNPAVRVTLLSDGAPAARQWLFHRADMKSFSHATDAHFRMELIDFDLTDDGPVFVVEVTDGHDNVLLGRVVVGLGEKATLATNEPTEEEAEQAALAAAAQEPGWIVRAGPRVPAYATVLSLTRNPVIPTIYAGCTLMMIGLYMGFFVRRRDVWFLVDEKAQELHVAAHYRHPSDEFDRTTAGAIDAVAPAPTPQEADQ